MFTVQEATTYAQRLVDDAVKSGANAADAVLASDASTDVQIRLGKLEDVQRSEGAEIGLRVFIGRKSASVSGSDLSDDGLSKLVERAIAMAKMASDDQYAGLAPQELLYRGDPIALDIDDGADPDPQFLRNIALVAEDAARAVIGVTNSEGGSASAARSVMALATGTGQSGNGFAAGSQGSRYACSASVLAGSEGAMERDYAFQMARHLDDLEPAETIGKRAGDRAVARLNPQPLGSGAMPVIFDPRVGNSILGHLVGAISGSAITRKTSFLLEKRGERIFRDDIHVVDDPHRLRGLRSRWFDGEGLATAPQLLIDEGVLGGWLLDSASARQLGEMPTGHAARGVSGSPGVSASNVHLQAGNITPEELMGDIKHGIYVTELIGQGVNMVTGDYSRGAGGFAIRDGRIDHAVSEITLASNLIDMFANLTVANDLEMHYAMNVPTLRIDGMTIAAS